MRQLGLWTSCAIGNIGWERERGERETDGEREGGKRKAIFLLLLIRESPELSNPPEMAVPFQHTSISVLLA